MKGIKNILHFKNVVAFAFLFFMVFNFLFFIVLKKEDEDLISNKTNAPFPHYDSSGLNVYMKNMELYFVDHFPFKYNYISLSNNFKTKVFRSLSSNSKVVAGKEGWLFYNANIYDSVGFNEYAGQEKWKREELVKVLRNIYTIEAWCKKNNIKFELIICPNKQSVYGNYLPSCYSKTDNNRYDQIMEKRPDLINLKKILLSHKERSRKLLYYKTDTHWNKYGAYLACWELNKRLQKYYPLKGFNDINIKNFYIDHGMDLANMLALKSSYTDWGDSITFKKPASYKIPHLVIVHDSYMGLMETSLSYMFDSITPRQLYADGIPSPQYLLENKTDVFVIEVVERYKEVLTWDIHPDYYK